MFCRASGGGEVSGAAYGGQRELLAGVPGVPPANVTTMYSNSYTIREKLAEADLVIGAMLLCGAKAPVLRCRARCLPDGLAGKEHPESL